MQDQRATENPYAAPEAQPEQPLTTPVSWITVIWELVVAVFAFFLVWFTANLLLTLVAPHPLFSTWLAVAVQPLFVLLAAWAAQQHFRSTLRNLREADEVVDDG